MSRAPVEMFGTAGTARDKGPWPLLVDAPAFEAPALRRGSLVVIRQFDVSSEIDLERAAARVTAVRARPRATALQLSNPPLVLSLGAHRIELGERSWLTELTARVFDFGAISLRFTIPLPAGTPWDDIQALVRATQTEEPGTSTQSSLSRESRLQARGLVQRLGDSVRDPHATYTEEEYTVVFAESFETPPGVPLRLPGAAVAQLLLGEKGDRPLSSAEVAEALTHGASYYADDLCICEWNTSFVVEPSGETDALELLELANAQLLQLRVYDARLDEAVARAYDDVEATRTRWTLLRNYGSVQRRILAQLLDISECIERAENALKITGEVYLARLYAAALDALRIDAWERSVTRKQALLQGAYEALKAGVDTARGQTLELTVVLLIVWEIVLALRGRH